MKSYTSSEIYDGVAISITASLNTGTVMLDNGSGHQVPFRTHTVIIVVDGEITEIPGVLSADLLKIMADALTNAKANIDNVDDPALVAALIDAGYTEYDSLAAPANFAATPNMSNGDIVLTWDNDAAASDYILERSDDPTFSVNVTDLLVGSYTNPITDLGTGLTNGATYYYRVVAHQSTGDVNSPISYADAISY